MVGPIRIDRVDPELSSKILCPQSQPQDSQNNAKGKDYQGYHRTIKGSMSATRRQFLKAILPASVAIPAILAAQPLKRYTGGPGPGWWIDGKPCTPKQWWDTVNYPHKHERVYITKHFSFSTQARKKYREIQIDLKPSGVTVFDERMPMPVPIEWTTVGKYDIRKLDPHEIT